VQGGSGGATTEDEHSRSPRRGGGMNKRRGPAPGAPSAVPDRRKGRSAPDTWVGGGAGVFSEQDLIEREARLLRAGGFLKKRRQDLKRAEGGPAERALSAAETGGKVAIAAPFTIKDLSAATGVKGADIVKKLFLQGIMTTINAPIDVAKAQEIMIDFDIELVVTEAKTAEEAVSAEFEKREAEDLRPRGPVVTILGHVDHGKTSLLDKIRNANVAAGEAGGITQRTSAFRVPVEVGGEKKEIVFLDTPGHQAFTSMRARGANVTDVVVLVVSPADGGVMPQTIESISHAKAAKVPIVVALNKIDRPEATEANIQKTLGQLAEHGLNPVEWGGDTEVVKTSAINGKGVKELLETLDYQAQLKELKADFGGHARGRVIEAKMEEGRGTVANILVQDGKLQVGDFIVAGRGYGRVRDITDDRGNKIKEALPPAPCRSPASTRCRTRATSSSWWTRSRKPRNRPSSAATASASRSWPSPRSPWTACSRRWTRRPGPRRSSSSSRPPSRAPSMSSRARSRRSAPPRSRSACCTRPWAASPRATCSWPTLPRP
jgi:translation initiation factor IF-2